MRYPSRLSLPQSFRRAPADLLLQSFACNAFACGRTYRRIRVPELKKLGDELLAGGRFSRFLLRLRRGSFPCASPLLSGAPFARSRFGFWLFRGGPLPLSRCFAFLTHLLLVQILSKLLISKTAAKAGSSNCQCSCDLNWPAARCHVPRTFV